MLFIDDDSKRITDYDNPGIFFAIDSVHRRGRAIRRRLASVVACIFTVYLLLLYWAFDHRSNIYDLESVVHTYLHHCEEWNSSTPFSPTVLLPYTTVSPV